jgi:hypothetical protein
MKKIFFVLITLVVLALSSFCEASEESNAKYINDNYVKPSITLSKDDFLPKMDEVLKNYSTDNQDRAAGDLAYYYRPKFIEIKEKLIADKKAKDTNLKRLAETVIQCEIDLVDVFLMLRNKDSYTYDSYMEKMKESASNLKKAVTEYKTEYETITKEQLK